MSHKAEIIAVGSELLLGNVAYTDAQYVSEKLAAAGVDVLYHTTVGDNPRRLRQVTDIARKRCNLLIFIGGLGPTYDDLTKETVLWPGVGVSPGRHGRNQSLFQKRFPPGDAGLQPPAGIPAQGLRGIS